MDRDQASENNFSSTSATTSIDEQSSASLASTPSTASFAEERVGFDSEGVGTVRRSVLTDDSPIAESTQTHAANPFAKVRPQAIAHQSMTEQVVSQDQTPSNTNAIATSSDRVYQPVKYKPEKATQKSSSSVFSRLLTMKKKPLETSTNAYPTQSFAENTVSDAAPYEPSNPSTTIDQMTIDQTAEPIVENKVSIESQRTVNANTETQLTTDSADHLLNKLQQDPVLWQQFLQNQQVMDTALETHQQVLAVSNQSEQLERQLDTVKQRIFSQQEQEHQ